MAMDWKYLVIDYLRAVFLGDVGVNIDSIM